MIFLYSYHDMCKLFNALMMFESVWRDFDWGSKKIDARALQNKDLFYNFKAPWIVLAKCNYLQ